MNKKNAERRLTPRIMCHNKLSLTSHDGYQVVATGYDLSSVSAQIRCDLRSAFVLNPSGDPISMSPTLHPVRLNLVLPIHGELIDIHADCSITGFRHLSENEVAVTLRFIEFKNQCDDQLRYFIDTSLANEIFGEANKPGQRQPTALDRLGLLLPGY